MTRQSTAPSSCDGGGDLWPSLPVTPRLRVPRSAGERWARFVLRACDSEGDLSTIREWASAVGASYSVITAACRIVGLPAHAARDFMRALRVLWRANGYGEGAALDLLISDPRTLAAFLRRAGIGPNTVLRAPISLDTFLAEQHFIDPGHPSLEIVRALMRDDVESSE
jgi:hypothetical protein